MRILRDDTRSATVANQVWCTRLSHVGLAAWKSLPLDICCVNKYTLGGGSESSADGRSATGRAARRQSPYDVPAGGRQPTAFSE